VLGSSPRRPTLFAQFRARGAVDADLASAHCGVGREPDAALVAKRALRGGVPIRYAVYLFSGKADGSS
jgi:hypothetical protein